jgi:hypothetical protein
MLLTSNKQAEEEKKSGKITEENKKEADDPEMNVEGVH